MEEPQVEASPRVLSRIGGVLYLIIIVGGIFGEAFIRNRLIVTGNATATASKYQVAGVPMALRCRCRTLHVDLRCCLGTDLLCLAEAGQQRSRFAGDIFPSGIDRARSSQRATSPCGVVSAGECCIPQSI